MPPTVIPGAFSSPQSQFTPKKARQGVSIQQGISSSVTPDKKQSHAKKSTSDKDTSFVREESASSSGYTSSESKNSEGDASSPDRKSSNRYSSANSFTPSGSSSWSSRSSKDETPIHVNIPSTPPASGTSNFQTPANGSQGPSGQSRSKKANFRRSMGTPTNLFGEDSESEDESESFEFPLGAREDEKAEGEGVKIPKVEVKLNYTACHPRIDWSFKQVILQAQAITFADGVKIDEQECADTNKRFLIQKDYNCIECEDTLEKKSPPEEGRMVTLILDSLMQPIVPIGLMKTKFVLI